MGVRPPKKLATMVLYLALESNLVWMVLDDMIFFQASNQAELINFKTYTTKRVYSTPTPLHLVIGIPPARPFYLKKMIDFAF